MLGLFNYANKMNGLWKLKGIFYNVPGLELAPTRAAASNACEVWLSPSVPRSRSVTPILFGFVRLAEAVIIVFFILVPVILLLIDFIPVKLAAVLARVFVALLLGLVFTHFLVSHISVIFLISVTLRGISLDLVILLKSVVLLVVPLWRPSVWPWPGSHNRSFVSAVKKRCSIKGCSNHSKSNLYQSWVGGILELRINPKKEESQ